MVERGHAVHGECVCGDGARRGDAYDSCAERRRCYFAALVGTMVIINLRKERGVSGTSEGDLAKRESCC